jgi:hypothetical protein
VCGLSNPIVVCGMPLPSGPWQAVHAAR